MDTSFRARLFPWFVRTGVVFTLCVAFGGLFVAEAELPRELLLVRAAHTIFSALVTGGPPVRAGWHAQRISVILASAPLLRITDVG